MSDNAQGLITPPAGYGPPNPDLQNLLGAGVTLGSTVDGVTTGYKWTVGGEKFDRYEVNTTNASTGTVIAYDEAELAKPIPRRWIWRVPNAATTVTGEADVKAGMSSTNLGKATVSKTVSVQEPTHTLDVTLSSSPNGAVRLYNWTQANPFNKALGFWVSCYDFYVGEPGITFKANVTTPVVFYSPTSDYGKVQYVQKFTPNRTYYKPDGTLKYAKNQGEESLDTQYPYPVNQGSNVLANGGDVKTEDSPGTLVQDTIVITDYDKIIVDESFYMYLMYKPPTSAEGSDWVNLNRVNWKWTANAEKIQNAAGQRFWQGTATPVGSVAKIGNIVWYQHPEWVRVY
jgi:hypothetical protein